MVAVGEPATETDPQLGSRLEGMQIDAFVLQRIATGAR